MFSARYSSKNDAVEVPSVGSDDEDSFEVLNNPSPEVSLDCTPEVSMLPPITPLPIENLQLNVTNELQQISAQNFPPPSSTADEYSNLTSLLSNAHVSPEISYQEIQKKVEALIKENDSLKNTLMQNNLNLKSQHEKIHAWHNEMQAMSDAHKNKLIEAKSRIDKLVDANVKLAEEVDKYKNIKELQDEEILLLKRQLKEKENCEKLSESSQFNLNNAELEQANKQLEIQKSQAYELLGENTKLIEECSKLREQILHNSQKREMAKTKLGQEHEALKEEMRKVTKQQELFAANMRQENENLKEYNEQLRKTNESQGKDIVLLNNRIDEMNLRWFDASFTNEDGFLERRRNTGNIQNLQDLLLSRNKRIWELQDELVKATNNEKDLSVEITCLKKELAERPPAKWDPSIEEKYAVNCQQLMNAQIFITELEQKMKDLEKKLRENSDKDDTIFALEQQVDLFKNDFEAERVAKNNLKTEKDQLEEDLANLQRRNQQLQEEVEAVREHNFVFTPSEAAATPSSRNGSPIFSKYSCPICNSEFRSLKLLEEHVESCINASSRSGTGYNCPKCDFGFNSYQALENHVHRCLDLDVC